MFKRDDYFCDHVLLPEGVVKYFSEDKGIKEIDFISGFSHYVGTKELFSALIQKSELLDESYVLFYQKGDMPCGIWLPRLHKVLWNEYGGQWVQPISLGVREQIIPMVHRKVEEDVGELLAEIKDKELLAKGYFIAAKQFYTYNQKLVENIVDFEKMAKSVSNLFKLLGQPTRTKMLPKGYMTKLTAKGTAVLQPKADSYILLRDPFGAVAFSFLSMLEQDLKALHFTFTKLYHPLFAQHLQGLLIDSSKGRILVCTEDGFYTHKDMVNRLISYKRFVEIGQLKPYRKILSSNGKNGKSLLEKGVELLGEIEKREEELGCIYEKYWDKKGNEKIYKSIAGEFFV